MASTKEYLEFVLEQLSELEEISYRAMMGEFIIYYRGKIAGGEKDIAVYLIANENAVPFYEKLGMKKSDCVMQYNHADWTERKVE